MIRPETDLVAALRAALPAELHPQISSLAHLLTDAANGVYSEDELYHHLTTDPSLTPTLQALAGQKIESSRMVLTFGGDYAERSIDKRIQAHVIVGTVIGEIVIAQRPSAPTPIPPVCPQVSSHFVGRTEELAYFKARLIEKHFAVITGMAGAGKTSLATVLVYQIAPPEKLFWHQCYSSSSFGELIEHLTEFLAWHGHDALWQQRHAVNQTGGKVLSLDMQISYIVYTLQGHNFLLYLDDVQYIDTDDYLLHFIDSLRPSLATGTVSLLITSRRVPSFSNISDFKPLEGLCLEDTRTLLATQNLMIDSSLITALHEATGGNAELLILTMNALHEDSHPSRLIEQLATHSDIVHYLMNKIHARLVEDQRAVQVMRALSALNGYPGTRDALEAILDQDGLWETLHRLEQRYLVSRQLSATGEPQYIQHALVQNFYYQQIGRRELRNFHRRASSYYTHEEVDYLRAALHCEQVGDYKEAIDLVINNLWSLINSGHAQSLSHLFERFQVDQITEAHWINICIAKGDIYTFLRKSTLAHENYQTAFTLINARVDFSTWHKHYARVCLGMGELLEFENPQAAVGWLQQGITVLIEELTVEVACLYRRLGSVYIVLAEYTAAQQALTRTLNLLPSQIENERAHALTSLGVLACMQSHFQEGQDYFTEAHHIYQRNGESWSLLGVQQNLGSLMEISGTWEKAVTAYTQALTLAERLHHVVRQTELTHNLGILRTKQGDFATAHTLLNQSLALAQQYQLHATVVAIQTSLADLYVRTQDYDKAVHILTNATYLANELAVPDQDAEIARMRALICLAQGELSQAHLYAQDAIQQARNLGDQMGVGISLRVLGQVQSMQGQHDAACKTFNDSLTLVQDDPYETAQTQAHWGMALVASQYIVNCATHLQTARTIFEQLGAIHDLAWTSKILNDLEG